jgi:RNA polymerase sigma-70 factor (ECF subfamily)
MRARWEALHAGLERSVRTLQAEQSFQQAKARHPELAGFDDTEKVVDYLVNARGDGDEKDRLLATLVAMVQEREHPELASALLWLGLWPGLSGLFGRHLRHFAGEVDELLAEVARAFTELVERIDLASVHRVAATLVRSTERDVMYRKKRAWAEPRMRRDDGSDGDEDTQGEPYDVSCFDALSVERWRDREHGSALGLTRGLSFEEDIAVLRAWLEPVVGDDAELLLAVLVEGESRREVGERLGLASDSGRKRIQRGVARLKRHLAKSAVPFRASGPLSPPTGP